ncbi:MAG: glycosyltransferase family 2 protein [Eubacteriales bacterium]|nr:glycosyltransferase family 2 protein [Eubacteriales bacterium]
MTVDVIIPTYKPGESFEELLKRIMRQEYSVRKIIVMNTEKEYWNTKWETQYPNLEVHHLTRAQFDHGRTRKTAAEYSEADIMVFMTQDAFPADRKLIGNLMKALTGDASIGAAYARQLPKSECRYLERYTRSFNYPEKSSVKYAKDIERYGIKTYFCSNVCAAYRKNIYLEIGGFVDRAIFNEDMIAAANMINKGYGIAYAADAQVYHSHNYSCAQQFHRNFDLGVSQAEHPEIFDKVPSEGEGLKLVMKSAGYLLRHGRVWLLPQLAGQSAAKLLGYRLGKRYQKLSPKMIRKCTMNPAYWERITD